MSTVKTYNVDSGDTTSLTLKTNNTAAVTIDSSQNVGIGTTSPGVYRLNVTGPSSTVAAFIGNNNNNYISISDNNGTGVATFGAIGGGNAYMYSAGYSAVYAGGAERMRVDSSGNVGIGAAPAGGIKLDVSTSGAINIVRSYSSTTTAYFRAQSGNTNYADFAFDGAATYVYTSANVPMLFYTNNAERMRISNDGQFLVGTTNTSITAGAGLKVNTAGVVSTVTASTTGVNFYHLYSTGAAAFRFYVGSEGRVYCTNTTITAISDERLKENIRDLDDGLDIINRLKPRKFDWKEGKGANIKNARGFIAQEFEQVFPDLIMEWLDPAPEGEKPYKAVSPDILPVLVKAIQELSAKIDEQTAKIEEQDAKIAALIGGNK